MKPLSVLCVPFRGLLAGVLLAVLALPAVPGQAGLLQNARTRAASAETEQEEETPVRSATLPPGTRLIADVAYGSDARQRLDVYAPEQARGAPILVMVHGGGWRVGDKRAQSVVDNKLAHWAARGVIFVSVNYRMLPAALPLEQARDVARAIAAIQARAGEWGGDARKLVLMGHSAGAHLIALLTATPELAAAQGAHPWLGGIALDSAALDVEAVMQARHLPLYDHAFGSDPSAWAKVSPLAQLTRTALPLLAVCSSLRTLSCPDARRLAVQGERLGVRVEVLPEARRHAEINADLGMDNAYTVAVDRFLHTLDPAFIDPGMK